MKPIGLNLSSPSIKSIASLDAKIILGRGNTTSKTKR
jgi:hypothetical protein